MFFAFLLKFVKILCFFHFLSKLRKTGFAIRFWMFGLIDFDQNCECRVFHHFLLHLDNFPPILVSQNYQGYFLDFPYRHLYFSDNLGLIRHQTIDFSSNFRFFHFHHFGVFTQVYFNFQKFRRFQHQFGPYFY